jgi:hypothetical protein
MAAGGSLPSHRRRPRGRLYPSHAGGDGRDGGQFLRGLLVH